MRGEQTVHYYVWYGENNNIIGYLQTAAFCAEPAVDVGEEEFRKLGLYSEYPSDINNRSVTDFVDKIVARI